MPPNKKQVYRKDRHAAKRSITITARLGGRDDPAFDHVESQAQIRVTTPSSYLRHLAEQDRQRKAKA